MAISTPFGGYSTIFQENRFGKFPLIADDWTKGRQTSGESILAKNSLRYEVLPERQMELYRKLKKQGWLHAFYLAGGTALALQIGHRQSLDFDFFLQGDFENQVIYEKLKRIGRFELFSESENTLHGLLDEVNVSFLGYDYPLLGQFGVDGNIQIASLEDIACMKLSAIASRGAKKDFIDIYFLLQKFPLTKLFQFYQKKYQIESFEYVLLKSLVYFEDADLDPMPIMREPVYWGKIKNFIIGKIKEFNLLGKFSD